MKVIVTLMLSILLLGCGSTHDLIKDVEGKAYDSIANAFSEYCQGKISKDPVRGRILLQEALELRREIRQRGGNGPAGPTEPIVGLDYKTAFGPGPVVRIYCMDEEVAPGVWPDFVRE